MAKNLNLCKVEIGKLTRQSNVSKSTNGVLVLQATESKSLEAETSSPFQVLLCSGKCRTICL